MRITEEYIQEMIILIEGELINFNNKRNQKILTDNATEVNRMARDGELDGVKLTSNGSIMGDPETVKKLRAMNLQSNTAARELAKSMPKKDNVVPIKNNIPESCREEIMERAIAIIEGSYTDENGEVQTTLNLGVPNGLDGRNIQQENKEKVEKRKAEIEAEKNKVKNPNRVEGGKKAHATRVANKTKEFYSRPLLQALNYTQEDNK